ncbi:hypothetical protein GWK91_11515 [Virgibacillus sp. MSP4-1]|uniref:YwmB family TATA-box binding protein n=1 Tax=Virgibacillus sp. MSP4-1 TaxID=2700081 RepID=UPI00039B5729|nr:YwmB family TATA-box binding protein [Virgibacillus sp. MSP4-1]QHS23546.1 hypothetical protein GWK91_11515 [Virgibacillus sp. MSP4-1]
MNKIYKKAIISISLLIFFMNLNLTAPEAEASHHLQPLNEIYSFFQNEQLKLTEWQVLMRDKVKLESGSVEQILNRQFPDASVDVQKLDNQAEKIIINNHNKIGGFTEQLSIVHQKNSATAEFKYVLTGKKWGENVEKRVRQTLNQQVLRLFDKMPAIFTCMRAQTSDNIKSNYLVDKFQEQTNMDKLKTLNEKNFNTVSGYIHKWTIDEIPISQREKMNVQMAVRNGLAHGSNVIIGTPILVTEY